MPDMRNGQRLRAVLFLGILIILVIIYVTTGESQTRNSKFYTRTVSLMEAKARGESAASELLHKTPEPEEEGPRSHSDGQQGSRRRARVNNGADVDAGNAGHQRQNAHATAQGEKQNNQQGGQQPLVETDEDLKSRLKDAEKKAKKSADDKYRALKDIEDEVARDREERSPAIKPKETQSSKETKETKDSKDRNVAGRKKMPPYQAPSKKSPEISKARQPHKEEEDPEVTAMRSILADILSRAPVTIFSKSYCPFSAKAKNILLSAYTISPEPYVVELDLHPQGSGLQDLLQKTTGRRTVPNILVNGKTIGGGDEMELLWKSGELPARVKQHGGKKVEEVKKNFGYGEEPGLNSGSREKEALRI